MPSLYAECCAFDSRAADRDRHRELATPYKKPSELDPWKPAKIAGLVGLGVGTVAKLKNKMFEAREAA